MAAWLQKLKADGPELIFIMLAGIIIYGTMLGMTILPWALGLAWMFGWLK
ncbi:MAG: hypothetical protein ACRCXM_08875 [Beijerinckiaceae bacterium]